MKNFVPGVLLILTIVILSACGKASVESETKRWQSNQDRITRLRALYPGFSGALDHAFAEARTAMVAAEQLEGETKIAAMTKANQKASVSFIRELDQMDRLVQKIEDKITKAKQTTTKKNDQNAAWDAARRADNAIRESKNKLSFASVKEIAAANAITKSVKSQLDGAEKRLEEVMKVAKKVEKETKEAAEIAKEVEAEKQADIVCSYCKARNTPDQKECSKCSAPL
ncbi:MAG: hypothetical protein AB8G15_13160 [Saprospiraceae bacterium]